MITAKTPEVLARHSARLALEAPISREGKYPSTRNPHWIVVLDDSENGTFPYSRHLDLYENNPFYYGFP